MSRYVDNVVDTTGDPVVPILIATGTITSKVHPLVGYKVGVDKSLMVTVDRPHLSRPAVKQHQLAGTGSVEEVPVIVDNPRPHSEERTRGRTRLECSGTRERRDQDAAGLGLPPRIHDTAAFVPDHPVVPEPGFGIDRLADRAEDPE